jgi:general secretion pathway protein B
VVSAAPVLPAIPASSAAAPPVKPVEAAAAVPAGAAPKAAVTAVMRAVPLSSLPADERRQLPALVPGGSVWSDSAASRFVILDGQVLREGDALSTGLVLERIERKAAVLRWKDLRVEVPL